MKHQASNGNEAIATNPQKKTLRLVREVVRNMSVKSGLKTGTESESDSPRPPSSPIQSGRPD